MKPLNKTQQRKAEADQQRRRLLDHYIQAGKDDETVVALTGCSLADARSRRKHFELLKTIKP